MLSFIDFIPMRGNHAGNKARIDIDDVCRNMHLQCIEKIEEEKFVSVFDKIKYIITPANIYKMLFLMMKKGDVTLLQYPFYFNPIMRYALYTYIKHNKIILLLHDVDSLRAFGKSEITEEIDIFNHADVLIVHNAKMKERLIELGVNTPMVELEIFDYLLDDISSNKTMEADVVFAGNLGKSKFLNEINKAEISINLYGPGYNTEMNGDRIKYKGSYPSEQIPYILDGKFGLIWDGDSLFTCSGDTGEYLKYNNPHKLSLYLASGLPVIVWKNSAIAEFVLSNKVGMIVDNILDIKDKIDNVSLKEYEDMKKNVSSIQQRICNGEYTKDAIKKAFSMIM